MKTYATVRKRAEAPWKGSNIALAKL